MLLIAFPNINPVAVSVGPLSIHWYALSYVVSIILGWLLANKIVNKFSLLISKKNLEDFYFAWLIIGIIAGARLGLLFYEPIRYLSHPLDLLKTYEGGMSFHGSVVGVIVVAHFFCRKYKISFLTLTDLVVTALPIGLFFGRITNFINAELYGTITNVSWAVIFPESDMQPRHPSQLYEAFAEGLLLFAIMLYAVFVRKTINRPGLTGGIFLIAYSIFRIVIENFREPDAHIGFIFNYITMGQILSLPLLIGGGYMVLKAPPLKGDSPKGGGFLL